MQNRPSWQPPALADVARVAGVSPATASRVLSGGQNVSKPREHSVLRAAEALGYRAHHAPTASACITVFTTAVERFGYSLTLTGVVDAARSEGLLLKICVIDGGSEAMTSGLLDHALSQPMIGAIVVDFDVPAVRLASALPRNNPLAIAGGVPGEAAETWAHCFIDDRAAARSATAVLLAQGHDRVHYLGVPESGHPEPRKLGWQDALVAAGLPIPPALGVGWSADRGNRAAQTIAADPSITAVLCGNDDLAIGLIAGLNALGRRVPEQISVVGFDDSPLAPYCQPPLTTVRQDFHRLGTTAVELLLELVDGGPPRQVEIPTEYVVRASTRSLP